jgi:hypothetical protein
VEKRNKLLEVNCKSLLSEEKHEFKLEDYSFSSISNAVIKQFEGDKSTDIIGLTKSLS